MTKGVYLLLIQVNMDIQVDVGALGTVNFEKGLYVYVGSAQNSLEKRIARHFSRGKRKFWHIDYLLDNPAVKISKVFVKEVARQEECKIAKEIGKTSVPVNGFGASDCKCKSHLFKVGDLSFLRNLRVKQLRK